MVAKLSTIRRKIKNGEILGFSEPYVAKYFSRLFGREITKSDFPGMAWNGSRMVRNGPEWSGMAQYGPIFPNIRNILYMSPTYSLRGP